MDVKVTEKKENSKVAMTGDIVVYKYNNVAHIITAQRVNGESSCSVGLDGTLWSSNPQRAVDAGDALLYKKEDWELVLRPKASK